MVDLGVPSVKVPGPPGLVVPASAPEPATFVKARRVRSFDDVVDQVRGAIIDGSILAGERLPSERELAEQFGVSRATLREALRALEAVGLIEIRLGARGGAFATEGDVGRHVESLRHLFDVEVAARPEQARRFAASLHADNATWVAGTAEDLATIAEAIPRGPRAFLLAMAECSRMPLRVALASAFESGTDGRLTSTLTTSEMKRALALLRHGHRTECRDLLFRLLDRSHPGSGT